jgi:hypothetical protein
MNKELRLGGPHLWTRESAQPVLEEALSGLSELPPGGQLVIDARKAEVFDYSFAAELFGRIALVLPRDYPGRLVIVSNLSDYARENLDITLERLNLAMVEQTENGFRLLGKTHPVDEATFDAIVSAGGQTTANELQSRHGISVNAANERLNKLLGLGLIRRDLVVSSAGRNQFIYRSPS